MADSTWSVAHPKAKPAKDSGTAVPEPPARAGWLLLHPDAVPARWRQRAGLSMLVPLLPHEVEGLLADAPLLPEIDAADEALVKLLATGLTTEAIALRLRSSPRSIQRRVARLRRRFGVESKEELTRLFGGWGFGEGGPVASYPPTTSQED